MRRFNKDYIALLASWLILFQLSIPLALAGMDITSICSAQGVERIALDADGAPFPLTELDEHCDLCLTGTSTPTAILAESPTAPAIYLSTQNSFFTSASVRIDSFAKGFTSRAPPSFSWPTIVSS